MLQNLLYDAMTFMKFNKFLSGVIPFIYQFIRPRLRRTAISELQIVDHDYILVQMDMFRTKKSPLFYL
jgi:hypothetical protein